MVVVSKSATHVGLTRRLYVCYRSFISLPFWTWWEQKHAINDKRAEIMRKRTEEEKLREEGRRSAAPSRPASFHQHHYQQHQQGYGQDAQQLQQRRPMTGDGGEEWDHEMEERSGQEAQGGRAVQDRTPTPIFGKAE